MLIAIIILAMIILIILSALLILKNDPGYIIDFLKKNPTRSSICIIRNDEVIISAGEKRLMPLASTVKIMIALAYTNQVSKGLLVNTEMIDLDKIKNFYLPGTDAGAHNSWLNELNQKELIQNNSVPLDEVVKGMIKFSSNANAEYLLSKIKKENIEASITEAGIVNHTAIYPFVSSLIVSAKHPGTTGQELIDKSWEYHEKIKQCDDQVVKSFKTPDLKVQKTWSDHLPASTTKDYCVLMNAVNTGKLFDKKAGLHVREILEWPPINKSLFTSFGIKGGSTAFIVTEALYATDASGNSMALAIFFNDLKDWERIIIDWTLSKFEIKFILNEKFRNKVRKELSG